MVHMYQNMLETRFYYLYINNTVHLVGKINLSALKDANSSAASFVQVRHNLICIAKYHYYN